MGFRKKHVIGEKMEITSEISVKLIDTMGGDNAVVSAMMVSRANDENLEERIDFLMKHRHGTPFEHGALTFYVDAPIMVWRQWHRHRIGMSYNEESGRYRTLRPKFWYPRQDRVGNNYLTVKNLMVDSYSKAWETYTKILEQGPEIARAVLPVATYSRCWVTCNPRSLMHFLSLRVHSPSSKFETFPQYEIQEAALACEEALKIGWPITYASFVKHGRCGP